MIETLLKFSSLFNLFVMYPCLSKKDFSNGHSVHDCIAPIIYSNQTANKSQ